MNHRRFFYLLRVLCVVGMGLAADLHMVGVIVFYGALGAIIDILYMLAYPDN